MLFGNALFKGHNHDIFTTQNLSNDYFPLPLPPVPPDLPRHPGKPLGALSSRLRSRSANRASASMLSTGGEDGKDDRQTDGSPARLGVAGYGTDNESVRTEDFENKFMNLLVAGSDSERGDHPRDARGVARRQSGRAELAMELSNDSE